MKISHLKELLTLAEIRSYSETAKRVHITQSALSKHVAAMEQELGAEIFARRGDGLGLTRVGESFVRDAASIVDEYDRAIKRVEGIKDNSEQTLYLGYFYEAAKPFLGLLCHWYERNKPHARLHIHSMDIDELMGSLRAGRVDVIIAPDVNEDLRQECDFAPIYSVPLLCAVSWKNPLSRLDIIDPSRLAHERVTVPSQQKWPVINRYVRSRLRGTEALSQPLRAEESTTLFDLIENDQTTAIVAGYNKYVHNRDVCFIPLEDESQPTLDVCAMWRKDARRDDVSMRRILCFKRALSDVVKSSAFRNRMM